MATDSWIEALHQKALHAASEFRRCEGELITILQEIDSHRVFLLKGHASLYQYAVEELRLSEASALNFIAVARKAKEIPELQEALVSGKVTVSKVRKLTRVLLPENASEWLEKLPGCLKRPWNEKSPGWLRSLNRFL